MSTSCVPLGQPTATAVGWSTGVTVKLTLLLVLPVAVLTARSGRVPAVEGVNRNPAIPEPFALAVPIVRQTEERV